MRWPSGLNAALTTNSVWPVSGWPIGLPVAHESRAGWFKEAVTTQGGAERRAVHPLHMAGERFADQLACKQHP